ncbi:nucleotidyltransferase domain-containing protein [Neptunicella marina]|uniref:Nucleotidyltransferase family protein n=1 Tax=Neptunicella marina TaxID=2125989 RepID=A0A8J6ITY7_9ALTE|nr:nucleotidyltransferase family protein [Neptunicella marina]MBC3765795.1 nucleotidyltransferase family protein [Neptunicella marina]
MQISQQQRQLIQLFRHPDEVEFSNIDWEALILTGRQNGFLARLYYQLERHQRLEDLPQYAFKHLHSAKVFADAQRQQAIFEANEINNSLSAIEISPVFLKGTAYTLLDHPVAYGRIFNDIDVLVPKPLIEKTEKQMLLYTWFPEPIDEYDQHYYRQWVHEIPPLKHASRRTIADVHHNILPPISGRAPNIDLFTQYKIKTEYQCYVLSPAALTLHSLVHLFFEEDFSKGFRDLSDLHILFSTHYQDEKYWQQLRFLAYETGFTLELFLACHYCEAILQTAIPFTFKHELVAFSPSPMQLKCLNWIFLRVLQPSHPNYESTSYRLARLLAMLRGHIKKMPIRILLYHTGHKLIKAFERGILGRYSDTSSNLQPQPPDKNN